MNEPPPAPPVTRRPERVPLSEEQKLNYQQDIDRFEEEKFAKQNSFPTKLLGWTLIAGFGLAIANAFAGSGHGNADILSLVAGIAILRGSQSWLRFATLLVVPGAIFGLCHLIGSVVLNYPIEIGRKWVDYGQLSFWTFGVSSAVFFLGESILAILAFRLRRIPFWTRAVKIFAGIIAALLMIQAVSGIVEWRRNRSLEREFSDEIQVARVLCAKYGGRFNSASIKAWETTFEPMTKVREVEWQNSPSSTSTVYERRSRIGRSRSTYRIERYTESLRLLSGEWGILELEVILPRAP